MQICFVHLGDRLPRHLCLNLERINRIFPNIPLVIVGNSKAVEIFCENNGYPYFEYIATQAEESFLESIAHQQDFKFRNGFWKFSLQRLFAASQFAQANLGPTLHIESDILILESFPFEKFEQNLARVSWQKFNESHDVASLLWFPSPDTANDFTDRILSLPAIESNTTDMTVLSLLAREHSELFDVIPSAGSEAQLNHRVDVHPDVTTNSDKFSGYFDAAAFGMWLFGQDPRNYYGFSIRYQELPHSRVAPEGTGFRMTPDGRCIDTFGNEVYSFHIHSKDGKLFKDVTSEKISEYIKTSNNLSKKRIFYFGGLLALLSDFRKRKMLIHLFYNIPIVKAVVHLLPGRRLLRKYLKIS